jgi:hypothetical protein
MSGGRSTASITWMMLFEHSMSVCTMLASSIGTGGSNPCFSKAPLRYLTFSNWVLH